MLPMADATIGHRDGDRVAAGAPIEIGLDSLPDEQNLAATKGPDVVHAFEEHAVLQLFPNGAWGIRQPRSELFG